MTDSPSAASCRTATPSEAIRSARSAENARLLGTLDTLVPHGGRIAQLIGEAGSGKSRLLTDLAREADRRGFRVLRAHCAEPTRQVQFATLLSALTSAAEADVPNDGAPPAICTVLRELTGIATERTDPAGVEHAVLAVRALLQEWAEGDGAGLVLILDDFHWADEASVALIECLIQRPVTAPLVVALGLRPRQLSARQVGVLGEGVKLGRVDVTELGPLTLAQSAELLELPETDPVLRRLHEQAEGNPLYLQTLWDRRTADGGRDRGDAFTQRLLSETALLSPHESQVAAAASVLGERFDPDALATVAQLDLEQVGVAVDALCGRDLLRPSYRGFELAFRHPLVQQAFYDQTDYRWRAQAHRRAVQLLRERWTPSTELAWHIEHSADPAEPADEEDIQVLMRAAADVVGYDPSTADRWMRSLLGLLQNAGDGQAVADLRVRATIMRTTALTASAGAPELSRQVRLILGLLPGASARARAEAIVFCCLLEAALTRHVEARTLLYQELSDLRGLDPADAGRLMITRATVEVLTGRLPDRAGLAEALELARRHGLTALQAGALALTGLCELWFEGSAAAVATLGECAELLDGLADADVAAHPEFLALLGWSEALALRLPAAERHLTRAFFVARQAGNRHLFPVVLNGLCFTFLHAGRLAEARRILGYIDRMLVDVNRGTQRAVTRALRVHGAVLAEPAQHETDQANPSARIADAFVPLDLGWAQIAALCLSQAALIAGDAELCAALVSGGGGPDLANIPAVRRPAAYAELASAEAAAGRPPGRWARRAAEAATLPEHRPYPLMCGGLVARERGDHAAAIECFLEAAAAFGALGMGVCRAFMVESAADCAVRLGRTRQAETLFGEAKQLARFCGAERVYRRIDAAAEGLLRTEPEAGDDLLAALTERERQIAAIAGRGKRTREIASQLRLSPRTVDVHLSRIYRKLNVNSRAALVARLGTIGGDSAGQ
ncbi:DNA-binding CsgD family transcriptional regulator [Catenulispora sp. GAS73]|uniref:AAA family ATPase n=1 Tax=Catenulispora sp. GAS73 TaxID=3156269 RepID=UPI003519A2DE